MSLDDFVCTIHEFISMREIYLKDVNGGSTIEEAEWSGHCYYFSLCLSYHCGLHVL